MDDRQPISSSRLRAWLQLLRAPNLFTVPGDPLAGFFLAWGIRMEAPRLLGAIFASLCFYCAGLLLNDLADFRVDLAERPHRPLPSGAARTRTVWIVAVAMSVLGLFLCVLGGGMTLAFGIGIVVAILLYSFALKSIPLLGPCAMGICRGLSLLLGTAFAGTVSTAALLAAGTVALYIAAVTNLARHETKTERVSPVAAAFPFLVSITAFFIFWKNFRELFFAAFAKNNWPLFAFNDTGVVVTWWGLNWRAFCIFFLPAIIISAGACFSIRRGHPLPPQIGVLIRALLFVQAAFCAIATPDLIGIPTGLFLIALWPLSRIVGARFYAS